MKTKKLIEILQQADPSGELECSVGGTDIFAAHTAPGYYDGVHEILVRDPLVSWYNVVGGIISSKGTKVNIQLLTLEDALFDSEANGEYFPICVDTDYVNPASNERFHQKIAAWRQDVVDFLNEE